MNDITAQQTSYPSPNPVPNLSVFATPTDPEFLRLAGQIFLEHAHLDHMLRMIVKILTDLTHQEAVLGLESENSSSLRRKISRIARKKLANDEDVIRVQALMSRCKKVTESRNRIAHAIWSLDVSGLSEAEMAEGAVSMHAGGVTSEAPSVQELQELFSEIAALVKEIQVARTSGFLKSAPRKSDRSTVQE